ncbi:MAG: diaminopimelate epimerase [Gammaproteobacteria bacterium]|nr:diaminopimelate epimerase [Gammaproteobacteria bacterium]MDH5776588.1 diaminopimelate epimerase [Gammaproteobacteria bacterium]
MELQFTKMHGLGNDFVVIDATRQAISLSTEQIRFLADRRFGVGCDQVLLVESANSSDVDFRYRIFNADGGEVEQCGNGVRCFARFVRDQGLTDKDRIRVETLSGIVEPQILANGEVEVNMGSPRLEPESIPFKAEQQATSYPLEVNGQKFDVGVVSMGNPHVVLNVENVDTADVSNIGPLLESDTHFPQRVNVGFMQVVNRQHIRLRVYERGSGETLACGTGACAAVVTGIQQGLLDTNVMVDLAGGSLNIKWSEIDQPVFMTGPATSVYNGMIEL